MTPPRFQFTIRGLLWATFWAAVSLAAWPLYFQYRWPMTPMWALEGLPKALSFILCVSSPFTAIGALFNQGFRGFLVGGTMVLVVYFIL